MRAHAKQSRVKQLPTLEIASSLNAPRNDSKIHPAPYNGDRRRPLGGASIGGISAGAIIDRLGFKGLRVGGAEVSDKHANFIINENHATAKDVEKLIRTIKKRAKDAYGITLKTEIEII